MRTIQKLSIVIIILSILSCSNDNSSSEPETIATVKDIYVCGYEKKSNVGKLIATVWKNGIATSLTDGTKDAVATDIAVSGENVYVVGGEENSKGIYLAKIWINGVSVDLTEQPSDAKKVIVSGGDIYVLGYVLENNSYVEKIWKNGIMSEIEIEGITTSLAVNNGDVYIVGFHDQVAKVWKNGIFSNLTSGMFYSVANDIEIKDNDVYIVGEEDVASVSVAKVWKNGVATDLSDGKLHNTAKAISIAGNDIYVSGTQFKNMVNSSKVWKNGKEIWSKENIVTKDF